MTRFVSSISGLPISAQSAAWAPTNSADVSAIASAYSESALSGKMDASASSQFQPSGDYQPAGEYYSASNPSGFITGVDLSDYATTGDVESAVSGKMDQSASSQFQPTSEMSSYVPFSSVGTNLAGKVTGINGSGIEGNGSGVDEAVVSAIASAYAESAMSSKLDESASSNFYGSDNPSGFITGVDLSPYQETAGMSSYVPFSSIGVDDDGKVTAIDGSGIAGGTDEAVVSSIASAYAESAVSGKMDASASSSFYGSDNPSGFITGVDLSPYQQTSAMTAYQPAGDYQPSGDYYSATNPSGFITGVDLSPYALSADVSGVIDTVSSNSASWAQSGGDVFVSGFGYNTTAISSIEQSSLYDTSAHSRISTLSTRISNVSGAVSGTVNLVSTQSANWGGSALQLSAGHGITLTQSGNILIIATA